MLRRSGAFGCCEVVVALSAADQPSGALILLKTRNPARVPGFGRRENFSAGTR